MGDVIALVVEDDDELREVLTEVLSDAGFDAWGAQNGADALDLLRASLRDGRRLPDVILLDLMMPVMDGRRFREVQRADPSLAQVPLLTAQPSLDSVDAVEHLRSPPMWPALRTFHGRASA
jgi:CheY-like chemotaxis protein